jgi:hypothetical protein
MTKQPTRINHPNIPMWNIFNSLYEASRVISVQKRKVLARFFLFPTFLALCACPFEGRHVLLSRSLPPSKLCAAFEVMCRAVMPMTKQPFRINHPNILMWNILLTLFTRHPQGTTHKTPNTNDRHHLVTSVQLIPPPPPPPPCSSLYLLYPLSAHTRMNGDVHQRVKPTRCIIRGQ